MIHDLMEQYLRKYFLAEPKLYSCSFCQKPFETAWSLVQHVQTNHGKQTQHSVKMYVVTSSQFQGIQIYSGPEPRRSEPLPKKSSPPSGPPPSFPGNTALNQIRKQQNRHMFYLQACTQHFSTPVPPSTRLHSRQGTP